MTCPLCTSPTVPNLLPNEDECKKFEIRAHSSLSDGQMHKMFFLIFVFIFVLIRLCLATGVLIPTYSYYFLTKFGSFLFVRMKYYVELSSGLTIFVFLAMSNWKKKRFYAFDSPIMHQSHCAESTAERGRM